MTIGPPLDGGPGHHHHSGKEGVPSVYDDAAASASIHSTLRPHQIRLIGEIDRALADGCRRIMAQAPTGFGKTIVAAVLAKRQSGLGGRVIFTVPALSLIDQT